MHVEEDCYPSPPVHRGGLVVGDTGEPHHLEPPLLLVVHEGVAGVRVLLHVVRNKGGAGTTPPPRRFAGVAPIALTVPVRSMGQPAGSISVCGAGSASNAGIIS